MQQIQKPSFQEALRFWFKLGWISFGGPAGQIAIMHEFLVEKKKWVSEKKFLHALNYCMLLPGPEAQQLATYTGWLLHGVKGGITAGLLFVLPSVFILLALSIFYVEFGKIPWVYAMFNGLKPAVVAIVIVALIKISKKSLQSNLHYILAALSFIAIFFFNISYLLIILSSIIIGVLFTKVPALKKSSYVKMNPSAEAKTDDETGYYITSKSVIPGVGFHPGILTKQVAIFFLLWLVPLAFFYNWSHDFVFWKNLSFFFTQSAFVTFGGAYAVLPYVAQQAVESYQWLNSLQMIDGLALGETTPGPLIMVLAFVGFMGAYHHFGNAIAAGTIGLLTTTYYTFLPSFLFIFAGAPLIERTQQNKTVKNILGFVTAAIVGVVLNLTIYFAEAVLFGKNYSSFSEISFENFSLINLGWIIISFIALQKFKIDMIKWILVSALFGLLVYFLF